MTVLWIVLGSVLGLLLVLVVLVTWLFFDYATRRKAEKPMDDFPPESPWGQMKYKMDSGKSWISSQMLETVEIKSFDGLCLSATILEAPDQSGKTVLMMHGFRAQDHNDFCTSVKYFHESGYNVVLAAQRCHGKSEGKYITFGIKERYDCRDWINFCITRWGEDSKLLLMGVSMGCATVLMTLGFRLPKNVRAVIADCGYTSPEAIFRFVIRNSYHLPPFPFLPLCGFLCKHLAGFDIGEYSTLEALRTNEIPVLFIHGEKDGFVPSFMSVENYEACKAPKELLMIEDAEHAMSFLRAPERCWQVMRNFSEKYM